MDKNQYIWDIRHTRCVKFNQIKEFLVPPHQDGASGKYHVTAWINANDYLTIHQADTHEDAVNWLNQLVA